MDELQCFVFNQWKSAQVCNIDGMCLQSHDTDKELCVKIPGAVGDLAGPPPGARRLSKVSPRVASIPVCLELFLSPKKGRVLFFLDGARE